MPEFTRGGILSTTDVPENPTPPPKPEPRCGPWVEDPDDPNRIVCQKCGEVDYLAGDLTNTVFGI
jgi:hypothetical protein